MLTYHVQLSLGWNNLSILKRHHILQVSTTNHCNTDGFLQKSTQYIACRWPGS